MIARALAIAKSRLVAGGKGHQSHVAPSPAQVGKVDGNRLGPSEEKRGLDEDEHQGKDNRPHQVNMHRED